MDNHDPSSEPGISPIRPHDIKESDWRALRRLQPLALERFCKRVLDEIESVRHDSARTFHPRYLDIYRIVEQRDRAITLPLT